MKHNFIIAIAALGMLLCSCDQSDWDIKEYNTDMSALADKENVIIADANAGDVNLNLNLPFDYYVTISQRFYFSPNKKDPKLGSRYGDLMNDVSIKGSSVSYPALVKDKDGITYTRDIALVANSKDYFLLQEADGLFFKFSVNIRQYGSKTIYYTGEDVKNFLANNEECKITDVESNGQQKYILGTVKSVKPVLSYDGFPIEVTLSGSKGIVETRYFEPCLWTETYQQKHLQAIDFVVDVDGAEAPVRVQYPASYKRIEKLASSIQVGKTVEIAVNKSGIQKAENGVERFFYILPSDIIVK